MPRAGGGAGAGKEEDQHGHGRHRVSTQTGQSSHIAQPTLRFFNRVSSSRANMSMSLNPNKYYAIYIPCTLMSCYPFRCRSCRRSVARRTRTRGRTGRSRGSRACSRRCADRYRYITSHHTTSHNILAHSNIPHTHTHALPTHPHTLPTHPTNPPYHPLLPIDRSIIQYLLHLQGLQDEKQELLAVVETLKEGITAYKSQMASTESKRKVMQQQRNILRIMHILYPTLRIVDILDVPIYAR